MLAEFLKIVNDTQAGAILLDDAEVRVAIGRVALLVYASILLLTEKFDKLWLDGRRNGYMSFRPWCMR